MSDVVAAPETAAVAPRDRYIDFLRAFSLLVVVAWHWVFTIVRWSDDGPHATNPIGFTTGLWMVTWLLQVMPLFFYVGGYSHLTAWQRAQSRGVADRADHATNVLRNAHGENQQGGGGNLRGVGDVKPG